MGISNSIHTFSTSQLGATPIYIICASINDETASLYPLYEESSSSIIIVDSAASAINGELIIPKPLPLPEDYDAKTEAFFRFLDELEAGAYTTDGNSD